MGASVVVYAGAIIAASGIFLALRPIRRSRVTRRSRAVIVAAAGAQLSVIGLLLPVVESSAGQGDARLDEFAPAWQFREIHIIKIDASPERVFDAIKRVRADEIFLFRTLTWIRRGGRQLPPGILNPGSHLPLIEAAISGGFVRLADTRPRELVIGTAVMTPPGVRAVLTPEVFKHPPAPGFALAAMNFLVTPEGPDDSLVSTETRVFATSAAARRRFAAYWRVIYPGSAFIRRMWLRAIQRRATNPNGA